MDSESFDAEEEVVWGPSSELPRGVFGFLMGDALPSIKLFAVFHAKTEAEDFSPIGDNYRTDTSKKKNRRGRHLASWKGILGAVVVTLSLFRLQEG